LAAHCASCHQPGQVGAAHWQLSTAGDASNVAEGIGVVTAAKYMPPWPASNLGVPLLHSKALDQKSIDTLVKWASTGGKLDEPASTLVKPAKVAPGLQPRHDVVMKMPQAYTGTMAVTNDYRCFILDPKFTQPTYMTGYEVTPDQIKEIHHAQVFQVPARLVPRVESRDAQDPGPGWQCYGGPGGISQDGLIAGWVPGQDPAVFGHDAGVLFEPGDKIVLQIHYHYDTTPTPDRSTLSIQTAPGTAHLKKLIIVNPLAPVEIPCMPGTVAVLCDRQAAINDDGRLYGETGSFVENGLLMICHHTPDELTAGFNGVASSDCDWPVPESGTIVGVLGHMHTLGKSVRLTLDPGKPTQKILLDIPTWNFDWQMNFTLATPIHVNAGQVVRLSCTWDRSLDPNRAPKYIVFAEGTEDEMCFGTYGLIPDNPNATVGSPYRHRP
jgi:hypothetical protein